MHRPSEPLISASGAWASTSPRPRRKYVTECAPRPPPEIKPINNPDNPSDVYPQIIEANSEKGTVTELGRFDDLGSAKLRADQDRAEKFLTPTSPARSIA